MLTVNPYSSTTPKPVPNFINNEVLIIYIVGFVCGAVVLASMIWLIVCTCKHKPCGHTGSNTQVNGAHRHRNRSYDKSDSVIGGVSGLPLANDYQIRKPMVSVVANQYTSTHRLDLRKGSLANEPQASEERGRLLEPISRPEPEAVNVIRNGEENDDAEDSSEKDSGTGDSQCVSREHLVDGDVEAKHGGGESTMSLTEFEATDLTRLDCDDDTIEEENSEGCGEAILSASNSILTDSSRTSVTDLKEPSTNANFRTFKPPQRRSLSRDFLNCDSSDAVRTESGSTMKKRGSAIELNGEKYLLIENHGASVAAAKMDPHVYRGGGKPQSGLEFNEKLLEHSLNSTDYSLQSRRQRSKILAAQVHSLPRKPKKAKNNEQLSSQTQSPKASEELYATVALKADDKLF